MGLVLCIRYAKLEEKVKQRNAELAAQKEIKRQLKARQEVGSTVA